MKVSVVIPIYNTSQFLDETLHSILHQNMDDYEVICVNDGSNDDKTLEILSNYGAHYSHLTVMNLDQHSGAAEARNYGLSIAKGEYVIFLDADDLFDSDMISSMYIDAKRNNADVCLCGFRYLLYPSLEIKEMPIKKDLSLDQECESFLLFSRMMPWNKLCKRTFLLDQEIQFQNVTSSNDVAFSVLVMALATRIAVTKEGGALLSYRYGYGSQISSHRDAMNIWRAYLYVENRLIEKGKYTDSIKKSLLALLISAGFNEFKNNNSVNKDELASAICREVQTEKVSFYGPGLQAMQDQLLEKKIGFDWRKLHYSYEEQLEDHSKELLCKIENNHRVVVWGNGQRSLAFQRFAKRRRIKVCVCESSNIHSGEFTVEGFLIIKTGQVSYKDIVIASNTDVYRYICNNTEYPQHRLINLEYYCPFG